MKKLLKALGEGFKVEMSYWQNDKMWYVTVIDNKTEKEHIFETDNVTSDYFIKKVQRTVAKL